MESGDPTRVCASEGTHDPDLVAGRWAVKYTTLLQKKCKTSYSGMILLHSDRRRLVLQDDEGVTVDAKIVSFDAPFSMGMSVEFPCHLVHVEEQIFLMDDDDHDQPTSGYLRDLWWEEAPWIWKVSYSTMKDLDRGRMKSYDGILKFWTSNGWLVLLNAKDEPIAVQVLRGKPSYISGSKVNFSHHVERINFVIAAAVMEDRMAGQTAQVDNSTDNNISASEKVVDPRVAAHSDHLVEEPHVSGPSFAMHTAITLGLDFKAGENFAKEVLRRFFQYCSFFERKGSLHFGSLFWASSI
jgi:hypothetical protein